jgi:hypothetical protein
MQRKEYSTAIEVSQSPEVVFRCITEVSKWWVKDIEGSSINLNDEFTVRFGTTWKSFKITELIPNKKMLWLVTDCNLPWNTDLKEWNNTKILWEISDKNGSTQIRFTHIGLSKLDCAHQCQNAWSAYIQESLFKYITKGKGYTNKF